MYIPFLCETLNAIPSAVVYRRCCSIIHEKLLLFCYLNATKLKAEQLQKPDKKKNSLNQFYSN